MTTKEKYEELRNRQIDAKSDAEYEAATFEMEELGDSDPTGFEEAVIASARQTLENAKALKVKEQLAQVANIISMSYIAKKYFNKSRSWLSQRVNELDVNGKPAKFLPEEINTLNYAIQDISIRLGTVRISC